MIYHNKNFVECKENTNIADFSLPILGPIFASTHSVPVIWSTSIVMLPKIVLPIMSSCFRSLQMHDIGVEFH